MFNHASRLTTNLLFHDIGHVLQRITGTSDIAYSPVMDSVPRSVTVHGGIRILSHNKEINIYISMQDLPAEQSNALQAFFGEISVDLKNIYQLVFKKKCSTSYIPYFDKKIYVRHYKEIVISVINNDREQYLNLLIPVDFFALFSKNINLSSSSDFIEGEVLNFFKNPRWMIPELIFLFSALSNVELNSLINQLQRKNLLTPYQIFLIIQGLPDLSGLIKSVLSKNAINDVIQFNKKSEAMKISRRDIAGGLYSVEESIFFIMRDGSDLHYSQFLRSMQSIIRSSLNYDILLKKKFSEWISDIITDDLLYATLSVTEDAVSALALSRESPTLMDQAVLLLVNGRSTEDVQRFCEAAGHDPASAERIVADARKRITVAADYARDEQLGRAVMRLNDLYAKSIQAQDIRTALQAQRELNRLLALYAGPDRTSLGGEADASIRRQIELIAAYLLPLKLTDSEYPIEEHARIAADVIRRHGHETRSL